MKQSILPFLSREVFDLRRESKIASGALLFADISGFTGMSEKLCSVGKAGTEELTGILNQYFDTMLEVVKRNGGDVLRFAGDALLVKFAKGSTASSCADEMMKSMEGLKNIKTSWGMFTLSMKIVMLIGEWNEFIIGTERRAELFLSGDSVKALARAEDKAVAGEVIAVQGKSSGAFAIRPRPQALPQESFLPEGVQNIIRKGMFGEHRPVACMFARIDGYDEDNPARVELQRFFSHIIEICGRYGGSLQLVDNIVPYGSKILVLFGAPRSYGDDVKRAVLAGRDMCAFLSRSSVLKVKIGINQGFVYSGIIGNAWRKMYTVIGDVVNTAARLMETASYGQVVISDDVYRLTNMFIDYTEIPSVKVKGKKRLLKRYVPQREKDAIVHRFRFVDREQEVSMLLSQVLEGKKVIRITGEAGIGKTRLLDEVVHRLRKMDCDVLKGTADYLKPALSMFTSMIKEKTGIHDNDGIKQKRVKLERMIAALVGRKNSLRNDPLYRRIPFIGKMLFDIDFPGAMYEQLSPQLCRDNLLDALGYFIEYHKEPVCVVIDDAHWMKREDIDALQYLARVLISLRNKRVSFILSMRPAFEEMKLTEKTNDVRISLSCLNSRSIDHLMSQVLGNKPLNEAVDRKVRNKAEGNPFYLEQLLLYLIQKNLIKEMAQKWVRTADYRDDVLPEDIFSTIMSRIDRLPELTKQTLRVASVIGFEFKEKVITDVLQEPVRACLTEAYEERLTDIKNIAESEYVFSQIIIKDVLYDSILRGQRRMFHGSVGKALERLYRSRLQDYYGSLALHFDLAEEWDKALMYNVKAGEQAKRRYANDSAIQYLKRASEIAQGKLGHRKHDLIAIYEHLADIYSLKAEYAQAVRMYREMYKASSDDHVRMVTAQRKIAGVYQSQGNYAEALTICSRSMRVLRGYAPDVVHEKAQLYLLKSNIYRILGKMANATSAGHEALERVSLLKQPRERRSAFRYGLYMLEGEAFNNLGRIYHSGGDYDQAIQLFHKALDSSREIGDKRGIAVASGNLGTTYKAKGDYQRAIRLIRQGLTVSQEIGDKRQIALLSLNLGNIFTLQGSYNAAIEFYQRSLHISEEIGDKEGIGVAYNNLGIIHKKKGDYKMAEHLFKEDLRIRHEMGDKRGVSIATINLGGLYEDQGKFEQAIVLYTRSLNMARAAGDREGIGQAYSSLSMASKIKGDYGKAALFLQRNIKIMKDIGDMYRCGVAQRKLGDIYIRRGMYDKAYDNLSRSLANLESGAGKGELAQAYMSLVELLMRTHNTRGALKFFNKALRIVEETGMKPIEALCYQVFGKVCSSIGDYIRGKDSIEQAIMLYEKLEAKKSLADCYVEYAMMLRKESDIRSSQGRLASRYFAKALRIYRELQLKHEIELCRKLMVSL